LLSAGKNLRDRSDQLPVQWQGDWMLVFAFDKS
jgi:hypothetical protein